MKSIERCCITNCSLPSFYLVFAPRIIINWQGKMKSSFIASIIDLLIMSLQASTLRQRQFETLPSNRPTGVESRAPCVARNSMRLFVKDRLIKSLDFSQRLNKEGTIYFLKHTASWQAEGLPAQNLRHYRSQYCPRDNINMHVLSVAWENLRNVWVSFKWQAHHPQACLATVLCFTPLRYKYNQNTNTNTRTNTN